ncbi:MSHA biogenesis protein MshP [Shewanella sp. VB17]|uniref:MSHA biogenesis protein MshP n=1 Tax=Shewanella sp. VB17 TaxID=2739432 RepID=UPI001564F59A|nr:MSHA biogenesis protein MshP [Shewanella sp. VB17]NRD72484.1 MSHA biogenesis protein MshP [Shewanella sp. VB17]
MFPSQWHYLQSSKSAYGHSRSLRQSGSALVIGIFVITVMFLMATALLKVLEDADEQVNIEVWGTRAFAAANSGADRALAELLPLDNTPALCANVSSSWDIGNENPTLVGFHRCSIELICDDSNIIGSTTLYRISSTATCQTGNCTVNDGNCLRVSRQVEVEARG